MIYLRNILLTFSLICLISCEDVKEYPWNDGWNQTEQESPEDSENEEDSDETEDSDGTGDAEKPENPADPENPEDPTTPEDPENPGEPENPGNDPVDPEYPPVSYKGKARMVWIDAAANFRFYANDNAAIESDMQRLKDIGFTGVIVDVRPTNTGVLFNSSTEHALTRVDAWVGSNYTWVERTASFDYLQAFIDAGKKVGLKVFASINTMVGGCYCAYGLGEDGILYKDASKQAWASQVNTKKGIMSCMDMDGLSASKLQELGVSEWRGTGARFMNPANDQVVEYLLNLLADLAEYDLAGIILDRCRYDDFNLLSDFSDLSKQKFEDFIGRTPEQWPIEFTYGQYGIINVTSLQKEWMTFRAKNIHDFVEKASARVHAVNPDIRFGAYVGGWYSSYYESGVNWASPKYETSSHYTWASADYNEYGYADHCDIMIIGAYAATDSVYGSGEWTMQGFCSRAKTLFAGDVPFVGGPDIGNSTGFPDGGQGALMPSIVDACINASTEGMFFFDLCHIRMYDYWDDIKTAFDQYLATVTQ